MKQSKGTGTGDPEAVQRDCEVRDPGVTQGIKERRGPGVIQGACRGPERGRDPILTNAGGLREEEIQAECGGPEILI